MQTERRRAIRENALLRPARSPIVENAKPKWGDAIPVTVVGPTHVGPYFAMANDEDCNCSFPENRASKVPSQLKFCSGR